MVGKWLVGSLVERKLKVRTCKENMLPLIILSNNVNKNVLSVNKVNFIYEI